MSVKLSVLLKNVCYVTNESDCDIEKIVIHSSKLCKGCLFVCIKGSNYDSHKDIALAISSGCSAIVSEEHFDTASVPCFTVENTRLALSYIFDNFYGNPSSKLKIFGVTGTNGKTTVANMLKSIYDAAGKKTGIIGTLTGDLTTPDPEDLYRILSEMSDSGIEYVFMEASSHALHLNKLAPIRFRYGIFTNLTPEHLDFHNNIEEYFRAKSKLFSMSDNAVINLDDKFGIRLKDLAKYNTVFYSAKSEADFMAKDVSLLSHSGVSYSFRTKDRMCKINSTVPGEFTVYNTLAAASCAYDDGISTDIIRLAMSSFKGVRGRLERVILPRTDFQVYIDFAHTPDALSNVLETVRNFIGNKRRLTLLFGCGGDRDKTKRPVMGAIASRLADQVIITSDNSRSEDPDEIIRQIMRGIDKERPYTVIRDRKEAIEFAISTAKPGDVILLTGKGHEDYEIDSSGKHPFNERDIVYKAVEKYYEKGSPYES